MNIVNDYCKQICELEWNFTYSVADSNIGNFEIGMVYLFEKEVVLGAVNLWETISISIYLIADGTFMWFRIVRWEVGVWLHSYVSNINLQENIIMKLMCL